MPEAPTGVLSSDETLVQLARGGDRSAREELFHRHWGIAYRVAYRLLGNEQDALDAVQDGFLKAVTHLDDFQGRSGFQTWLMRIVTHAALDLGRKRGRRSTLTLTGHDDNPNDPACEDDPAQGLHRKDLRRVIDAALDRLTPKIRATFVLFAEAEMSYEEIARTLEIPIGTVMSRINAARQKLQRLLDGNELEGI
jgi:RNA polymerase sigma-70 factor (ECF subfamily)